VWLDHLLKGRPNREVKTGMMSYLTGQTKVGSKDKNL
jgi:hypothetical protein